jgi:hypothetical protein
VPPIFESPTITVLTHVLIQQFEGNFLTPRIQGHALNLHLVIMLLVVIGDVQVGRLAGVIFAVLRLFFDFFRPASGCAPCHRERRHLRSAVASVGLAPAKARRTCICRKHKGLCAQTETSRNRSTAAAD